MSLMDKIKQQMEELGEAGGVIDSLGLAGDVIKEGITNSEFTKCIKCNRVFETDRLDKNNICILCNKGIKHKTIGELIQLRNATTLWRPIGPEELKLIKESGWQKFPPRLPGQPIFYPVCNQKYAEEITQWNVKEEGCGYVVRFYIDTDFLDQFEIQTVGASHHQEYWIPAEQLKDFNNAIVGQIECVREYK